MYKQTYLWLIDFLNREYKMNANNQCYNLAESLKCVRKNGNLERNKIHVYSVYSLQFIQNYIQQGQTVHKTATERQR